MQLSFQRVTIQTDYSSQVRTLLASISAVTTVTAMMGRSSALKESAVSFLTVSVLMGAIFFRSILLSTVILAFLSSFLLF